MDRRVHGRFWVSGILVGESLFSALSQKSALPAKYATDSMPDVPAPSTYHGGCWTNYDLWWYGCSVSLPINWGGTSTQRRFRQSDTHRVEASHPRSAHLWPCQGRLRSEVLELKKQNCFGWKNHFVIIELGVKTSQPRSFLGYDVFSLPKCPRHYRCFGKIQQYREKNGKKSIWNG